MPQEIRIVKCYKCLIFQADGVKKAKRWVCRLCGEKQTLRQEYGRGTGRECRLHVQNLNLNIKKQDEVLSDIINRSNDNDNKQISHSSQQSYEDTDIAVCSNSNNSKWSNFINEELIHDNDINNEDILLTESTKSNVKHNRKVNSVIVSTSKDTSKNNNVNNISNSKWEQYCSVENDDNNVYDFELSQLTELQEMQPVTNQHLKKKTK